MQTKVRVTYGDYIGAWCSFLFMIHFMNPAPHHVSPVVFAGFAVAAVYAIAVGLVMRKKFFAKSAEALRSDPRKAFNQWEAANMNPTIFGVALKFIGASWLGARHFVRHRPGGFLCCGDRSQTLAFLRLTELSETHLSGNRVTESCAH
jgi:hypothetical protein